MNIELNKALPRITQLDPVFYNSVIITESLLKHICYCKRTVNRTEHPCNHSWQSVKLSFLYVANTFSKEFLAI